MAIKGLLLVQAHVPVQTKPTPFHRVVVEPSGAIVNATALLLGEVGRAERGGGGRKGEAYLW